MYTKLELAATEKADLTFSLGYNSGSRGMGENPPSISTFEHDFAYLFTTLSLNYLLTNDLSLDLSLQRCKAGNKFLI